MENFIIPRHKFFIFFHTLTTIIASKTLHVNYYAIYSFHHVFCNYLIAYKTFFVFFCIAIFTISLAIAQQKIFVYNLLALKTLKTISMKIIFIDNFVVIFNAVQTCKAVNLTALRKTSFTI